MVKELSGLFFLMCLASSMCLFFLVMVLVIKIYRERYLGNLESNETGILKTQDRYTSIYGDDVLANF